MKLLYPVDPVFITQKFGERPSVYSRFGMKGHNGVDFRVKFKDSRNGKRDVYAAADGVVYEIQNQDNKGYGLFVRLRHGKNAQTIYAHLSNIKVSVGQKVKAGQLLGISGNTGFSSASHLHFGYRPEDWKNQYYNGYYGYVDPMPLFTDKINEQKYDDKLAKRFKKDFIIEAKDLDKKNKKGSGAVYYVTEEGKKIYIPPSMSLKEFQSIYKLAEGMTKQDIDKIRNY